MQPDRFRTPLGYQLAVEDRGHGAPTLLCVHGWTCDRSFFGAQAEHFAGRHRVISVDLLGHGESEKPPGGLYSIESDAASLAALVESRHAGPVVAIGHSRGALVALEMAARVPDTVAALVLVEPTPIVLAPELRAVLAGLAARIEQGDQGTQVRFIRSMFSASTDPAVVSRALQMMLSTPDHVAAAVIDGLLAWDGPAAAARWRGPTLHIGASAPTDGIDKLSHWLPQTVHTYTTQTGHFNQVEAPDQVNAHLAGFLRSSLYPPGAPST